VVVQQSCPKVTIVNKLRLKGVCGAVWISYEAKRHMIQEFKYLWFG